MKMSSSIARFVSARLSPEGTFGRHLTIGLLILIITSWLFSTIAESVVAGDAITVVDVRLAHWLHAQATPGLTNTMLTITHLHSAIGIVALSLVFGWYLIGRKEWYWLSTLALAVAGGMLLNVAIKHLFQRIRPSFDDPLLTLTTYSFPSGHTTGSTLFYGMLAAYLVCRTPSLPSRILIVLSACAMVTLTGVSRMVLGVHYLSDVLAAVLFGTAWLALCLTAISSVRRHRALRTPD